MRLIQFIISIAFGLFFAVSSPILARAQQPTDSGAARYIRTLFDATLPGQLQGPGGSLLNHCADIRTFGRFAAGRLWRGLPERERQQFSLDFCVLAGTAADRLHGAFPGLSLVIVDSRPAPQNMIAIHSLVATRDGRQWPVDWLIAGLPAQPHLADLRILDVSLGIILRGLATLEWSGNPPESLTSSQILRPWVRALDRALPPDGDTPPR